MAGKYDKESGVFAVENTKDKIVYLGKSTGVGVAIRDCKSKLNRGIFWNNAIKDDWIKYGGLNNDSEVFVIQKPFLLQHGMDLDTLIAFVQDDYFKKGYVVYNEIEIMRFDEDPFEGLELLERNVCERIVSAFLDGYLVAEELNDYLLSKNV